MNTAFPIAFKSGLIGAIPSSESEDDIRLHCLGGMLNWEQGWNVKVK